MCVSKVQHVTGRKTGCNRSRPVFFGFSIFRQMSQLATEKNQNLCNRNRWSGLLRLGSVRFRSFFQSSELDLRTLSGMTSLGLYKIFILPRWRKLITMPKQHPVSSTCNTWLIQSGIWSLSLISLGGTYDSQCMFHQTNSTCPYLSHSAPTSVRRSSSLDWKKDQNRTEPNCKRPDHRLRLHKFWIFSVASCDVCRKIEKPKKTGLDRLQPVFRPVTCWILLTHIFP